MMPAWPQRGQRNPAASRRQCFVQCGSAPDRPLIYPLAGLYTGVSASSVIGITNERHGENICHPGSADPPRSLPPASATATSPALVISIAWMASGNAGWLAPGHSGNGPLCNLRTHRQAEPLRFERALPKISYLAEKTETSHAGAPLV